MLLLGIGCGVHMNMHTDYSLTHMFTLMFECTLFDFLLALQLEAALNVDNLCTALEEVEWSRLADYLDVPESIKGEIKEKFPSITQRKKAMLEEWRTHHPAPSWMLVATALYCVHIDGYGKYHKVLQLVKQKYLQGENTVLLHMSQCVLAKMPISNTYLH